MVRPRNGGVTSTEPAFAALVEGDCASASVAFPVEVSRTPPVDGSAVYQPELCGLAHIRYLCHHEICLGVAHEDRLAGNLSRLVVIYQCLRQKYRINLCCDRRFINVLRQFLVEELSLDGVDSGGEVGSGCLESKRSIQSNHLSLEVLDLLVEPCFKGCHIRGIRNFFGSGACYMSVKFLQDSCVILLELGMFCIEDIDGSDGIAKSPLQVFSRPLTRSQLLTPLGFLGMSECGRGSLADICLVELHLQTLLYTHKSWRRAPPS